MLTKSIEQYRNHIEKKKTIITDLLLKGEKENLNAIEKHALLKAQRDLQGLDNTKKSEVPEQLISLEKLEGLSKTRKEAEAFLQSLINQQKKK